MDEKVVSFSTTAPEFSEKEATISNDASKAQVLVSGESYITHLDGLRAIAIIAVVLYHFEVGPFRGGYIGVDVFLVLSGFLMTRRLKHAIEFGPVFSLGQFYRGRFWRLYPASLTTVAVTLLVAYQILPQELHRTVVESGVATLTMTSNVLFSTQVGGYFDEGVILKPLLHTWSLAVEEQFYLVWPVLIYLTTNRPSGDPALLDFRATLAVLLTFSFALSVVLSRPEFYPVFSWFHLPTRAYEFGFGAVALLLYDVVSSFGKIVGTGISTVGLLLVAMSTVVLDREGATNTIDFPGWASLPCLIGTVAIIVTPQSFWAGTWALSSPPMRYIGKVSYSLYLAHWPVWVFVVYWTASRDQVLKASVLTVLFGLGLHYAVERKMRTAWRWRLSYLVFMIMGVVVFAGLVLKNASPPAVPGDEYLDSGSDDVMSEVCEPPFNDSTGAPVRPKRMTLDQKDWLSMSTVDWMKWDGSSEVAFPAYGPDQTTTPPRIVVVGDSFGQVCVVIGTLNEEGSTLCLTEGGCYIGLPDDAPPGPHCLEAVENIRSVLLKLPTDTKVFVALRWEAYEEWKGPKLLDWFQASDFADVIIVGSHPRELGADTRACIQRQKHLDKSIVCNEEGPIDPKFLRYNDMMKSECEERELQFADLMPVFSPTSSLETVFSILCERPLLHDDHGHFAKMGFRLAANVLEQYL